MDVLQVGSTSHLQYKGSNMPSRAKDKLRTEIARIRRIHSGVENIPVDNPYWNLVKQYQDMTGDSQVEELTEPTEKEKQNLDNEVLEELSGLFEKDK